MSASNWASCPRCYDRASEEHAAKLEALAAAYGEVDRDEWEAMRNAVPAPPDRTDFVETFREDYEIYGAREGTITVSYGGHCEKCGLSLNFNEPHPFYEPTTKATP